jgi:hypothetical protein
MPDLASDGPNPFDIMHLSASLMAPMTKPTKPDHSWPQTAPQTVPQDPLVSLKRSLLHSIGLLKGAHPSFYVTSKGVIPSPLLIALRVRVLTPWDLAAVGETPETLALDMHRAQRGLPGTRGLSRMFWRRISAANEAQVWMRIAMQCEKGLRRMTAVTVPAATGGGGGRQEGGGSGGGTSRGTLEGDDGRDVDLAWLDSVSGQWEAQTTQLLRACVLRSFLELASAFEEIARRQGTEEGAQGKGGAGGQSMVEWEEEMRRWWLEHRKWWAAAFG